MRNGYGNKLFVPKKVLPTAEKKNETIVLSYMVIILPELKFNYIKRSKNCYPCEGLLPWVIP